MALFKSIEECIWWAFYVAPGRAETVRPAGYVRFMASDEREQIDGEKPFAAYSDTEPKPVGYDAGAQAGLVQSFISRMPPIEACHLMASCLNDAERAKARRHMVGLVLPLLPTGIHHRRLIGELMAKHYGKRGVRIDALAKQYHLPRRVVSRIHREIAIVLDAVAYRSERRAYDELQAMGVIR